MDDWDFLEEVDVIGLWPEEQRNAVESTKWSERRDGLQTLVDIIDKNPRLSTQTMTRYGEIMDKLRKIISRDSNINVVAVAVKLLTLLAKGLRNKFSCFISMIFGVVLEKTKEKKSLVRDLLGDCLDALADTCPIDRLTKDLIEHIGKPNPQMKQLIDSFLYRLFKKQLDLPIPFVKEILPLLVKHCSDSDKDVRESSFQALGSAKRLIGPLIDNFLKPIANEEPKIAKISEYCEKATKEFADEQAVLLARGGELKSGRDTADNDQNGPSTGTASIKNVVVDPWTLIDPVNVWELLAKEYDTLVESKKWQERKEAMDALNKILIDNKRVTPGGVNGEKIGQLIKIIEKDVNISVAAGASSNLKLLAEGLKYDFAPYTSKALNAAFEKFKEKKAALKDQLCEMVDAIANTISMDKYTEEICIGLAKSNPSARLQTALFVSRVLAENNQSTLPQEVAKEISPPLVKLTNDADSVVRDASFLALGALRRCIGEKAAAILMKDVEAVKMKKIEEACAKLIEEKGDRASDFMVRLHNAKCSTQTDVPKGCPPRQTGVKKPASTGPAKSVPSNRTSMGPVRVRPTSATGYSNVAGNVTRSNPPSRVASRPTSATNSRANSPSRKGALPNIVKNGVTSSRPPSGPVTHSDILPSTSVGIRPNVKRPNSSIVGSGVTATSRPVSGIRPNVVRSSVPIKPNVQLSSGGVANLVPKEKLGVVGARPASGMRPPTAINIGASKMRPPTAYRAQ